MNGKIVPADLRDYNEFLLGSSWSSVVGKCSGMVEHGKVSKISPACKLNMKLEYYGALESFFPPSE